VRAERLRESHRGRGFAFAERGRGDGGHVYILAVGSVPEAFEDLELDLRFVGSVQLEFIFTDAQFRGDLKNRLDFCRLRNVDIRGHGAQKLEFCRLEGKGGFFRSAGFSCSLPNGLPAGFLPPG
jgi:hypothetical protein